MTVYNLSGTERRRQWIDAPYRYMEKAFFGNGGNDGEKRGRILQSWREAMRVGMWHYFHLRDNAGHRAENGSWNSIITLCGQIPIYLVADKDVGRDCEVPMVGRTDTFRIPGNRVRNPLHGVDLCSLGCAMAGKDRNWIDCMTSPNASDGEEMECLCLYTNQVREGDGLPMTRSTPRIFVWLDRIEELAGHDTRRAEILFLQSLARELLLASLDTTLLSGSCNGFIPDPARILYETFLAERASVILVSMTLNEEEKGFLREVVASRPFQYGIAASLSDMPYLAGDTLMEEYVWYRYAGRRTRALGHMLKCVIERRNGFRDVLNRLSRAIDESRIVLQYCRDGNGLGDDGYYYIHELVPRIVGDYIRLHPGITRSRLHEAFPDELNDETECMVDYAGAERFHLKRRNGEEDQTAPIMVFDLPDGRIALSGRWSRDAAVRLVKTSMKKHGFRFSHI